MRKVWYLNRGRGRERGPCVEARGQRAKLKRGVETWGDRGARVRVGRGSRSVRYHCISRTSRRCRAWCLVGNIDYKPGRLRIHVDTWTWTGSQTKFVLPYILGSCTHLPLKDWLLFPPAPRDRGLSSDANGRDQIYGLRRPRSPSSSAGCQTMKVGKERRFRVERQSVKVWDNNSRFRSFGSSENCMQRVTKGYVRRLKLRCFRDQQNFDGSVGVRR